jgi:hypothetical protein
MFTHTQFDELLSDPAWTINDTTGLLKFACHAPQRTPTMVYCLNVLIRGYFDFLKLCFSGGFVICLGRLIWILRRRRVSTGPSGVVNTWYIFVYLSQISKSRLGVNVCFHRLASIAMLNERWRDWQ